MRNKKYIPGNANKDVPMSAAYQTDYSKLSSKEKFEWDAAEEFLRAGMDQSEIYNLMDNDEYEADAKEYLESGMDGMEYARMLLNKWSGVPKHGIQESKLVCESLNEFMGEREDSLFAEMLLNLAKSFVSPEYMKVLEKQLKKKDYTVRKSVKDGLVNTAYVQQHMDEFDETMYDIYGNVVEKFPETIDYQVFVGDEMGINPETGHYKDPEETFDHALDMMKDQLNFDYETENGEGGKVYFDSKNKIGYAEMMFGEKVDTWFFKPAGEFRSKDMGLHRN